MTSVNVVTETATPNFNKKKYEINADDKVSFIYPRDS